ncbi:MAG: dTMP kinase, partial [Mycoplasma sp.]
REPGGNNSIVAESIRKLVLDHKDFNILPRTEALLFAASRAQHVDEVIIPSMKKNITVVCDRYIDSSLAYQGYARDLGFENIYNINMFATNALLPNITFFVDVSAETGMQRIQKGNRETNRLDEELMIMHEKAYAGYKELINKFPQRFILIDGNQTIDEVLAEVIKKYQERCNNNVN